MNGTYSCGRCGHTIPFGGLDRVPRQQAREEVMTHVCPPYPQWELRLDDSD